MKNQNEQMQIFNSPEFGKLEVLTVEGKPYFPATECAEILGYGKPHNAIKMHCRYSLKQGVPHPQSKGKKIEKNFIPEGDLYRLIIRSKLPTAEKFERWVFDEVLPTIRKFGGYALPDVIEAALADPKTAMTYFKKLQDERKLTEKLSNDLLVAAEKADYCKKVLSADNAIPITIIAKDYGMSAVELNYLLRDCGVQYKVGETWVLVQNLATLGLTKTRTYTYGENRAAIHTMWTQKGREFINTLLTEFGVHPIQ